MSGDFWGSQEGCQGPSRPSGRNRAPKLHQETKRHSPRRQGFRRDPAVRPSKLRAGADSRGRPKDGTGPLPLLRLCEVADALTVGLKALHPLQPLECPTPRGDTGTKGSLPGAGCPQSPPARAQNVQGRGAAARRVWTQRPTLHSPVRSPQRGGARVSYIGTITADLSAHQSRAVLSNSCPSVPLLEKSLRPPGNAAATPLYLSLHSFHVQLRVVFLSVFLLLKFLGQNSAGRRAG